MKTNIGIDDAVADYFAYLRGRLSPGSYRVRVSRIEHFRAWITQQIQRNAYLSDIADRDSRYMERYFDRLRPPGYTEGSFNNYRQYLKGFWAYARGRGWVDVDPMLYISALKQKRRARLMLSPGELIRAMEDGSDGPVGARDRIALAVAANTAIRAGDVTNLKVGDVDLDTNTITVWIEKTDEGVLFPITTELRAEIIRWFTTYAAVMGLAGPASLPNTWTLVPPIQYLPSNPKAESRGPGGHTYKTNKTLSNPEQIVHRALERLGHEFRGEGFGTWRRSAGRAIYELAGADGAPDPIALAQVLLNHRSRATTERYLGVTAERRQRDDMMRGKSFLGRAAAAHAAKNADLDGTGLPEVTELRRDRSA